MDAPQFERLADIEVDQVMPERNGFALSGRGTDSAEYRLEVHFDMPLDARTRTVLGELLSQSELTISRQPRLGSAPPAGSAAGPARRDRAHRTSRRRVTAD